MSKASVTTATKSAPHNPRSAKDVMKRRQEQRKAAAGGKVVRPGRAKPSRWRDDEYRKKANGLVERAQEIRAEDVKRYQEKGGEKPVTMAGAVAQAEAELAKVAEEADERLTSGEPSEGEPNKSNDEKPGAGAGKKSKGKKPEDALPTAERKDSGDKAERRG